MLPIVQESVKGEKVSIYNAPVQAKHPLNGLRLNQQHQAALAAGPDHGVRRRRLRRRRPDRGFAPGGERLMSYALDLDTEVASQAKQHLQARSPA